MAKKKKVKECRAPYGEVCTCFHCQMIARDIRDANRKKQAEVVEIKIQLMDEAFDIDNYVWWIFGG